MTPSDPHRGAPASPADVRPGSQPAPRHDAGRREIWNELDQSSVMSVELIAAILTWGGVGWLLDRWLDTASWFFGAGIMIGFAAGLYLVWYRSGKEQDYPNGAARVGTHDATVEGR